MVWTPPRTFVANELETASIFNTHLRDNLIFIHDVFGGVQDFGSDMTFLGTRNLLWSGSGVNHGMTALSPTTIYGAVKNLSPTAGGIDWEGYTDTDATAARVLGIVGTTTPTAPVVTFFAGKKNGTGQQALAATELAFQFQNSSTPIVNMYGSSGVNIIGGLTVGFSGVPAAAKLYVADGQFRMGVTGTDAILDFDTASTSRIRFQRVPMEFDFEVNSNILMKLNQYGVLFENYGIAVGLGASAVRPAGTIQFIEISDPAAPAANTGYIYMKDNGAGKTQFVAVFSSGAVQVMATQP